MSSFPALVMAVWVLILSTEIFYLVGEISGLYYYIFIVEVSFKHSLCG